MSLTQVSKPKGSQPDSLSPGFSFTDGEGLLRVWEQWEQHRKALCAYCHKRGIPPLQRELLVDEVLHRFLGSYARKGCQGNSLAWCYVVLRRLVRVWRRSPHPLPLELGIGLRGYGEEQASSAQWDIGTQDFWEWMALWEEELAGCCSTREWEALRATKGAAKIAEAAQRCGQSPRNYRILRDRAALKIFSAMVRNLVPPLTEFKRSPIPRGSWPKDGEQKSSSW